jgi:glucosamine kinase
VPYYLGIDGGGTKTTCALGDESQTLAAATAGPSNIVRVGESQARESLQQSVRQACAAAGVSPEQITRTCIGAAGAARPEIAEAVCRALAEILPITIDVVSDMQTAIEAAFDAGPGVIVNAGTGSFAYGRDRNGQTSRAGGLGFAIGDEGSAHWIGRIAVAQVLRAADRAASDKRSECERSPFALALMKAWSVISLSDLARVANSIPPADFAALLPAVAGSHDEIALEVLSRAGFELAELAAVITHRIFPSGDTQPVPVAMTGSVFRHVNRTREDFYNELRRLDPRVDVDPQIVEPVEGALRLARRAGSV